MAYGQPVTRRDRQQRGMLRLPGTNGLALVQPPFYRPKPFMKLGFGQIQVRLLSDAGRSKRNSLLEEMTVLRLFPGKVLDDNPY